MAFQLAAGPWLIVNDGVMGGRSTARVQATGDGLRFAGHLSLENNGGFSSLRRTLETPPAGHDGVRFQARGDGRRYQFRARRGAAADGVAWRGDFTATAQWRTIEFRFDALEPVYRGRPVPGAGPITGDAVGQVGFLIADGREGAFELEVRDLTFFTDD